MRELKFRAWDELNKIMIYSENIGKEEGLLECAKKEGNKYYFFGINEKGVNVRYLKLRAYGDNEYVSFSEEEKKYAVYNNFIVPRQKIMQYTGLKDCEGNDIYEGDVISSYKPGQDFPNIIANLNLKDSNEFLRFYGKFTTLGNLTIDKRILGNIHQHPELKEEIEK